MKSAYLIILVAIAGTAFGQGHDDRNRDGNEPSCR